MQQPQPLSVLLVGKSGSGKSSVGNALLRNPNAFPVGVGFDSTTLRCQVEQNEELIAVDTPDLAEFIGDEDSARLMLQEAFDMSSSGFDAILLVMRLDVRLTQEEIGVAHLVQRVVGPGALSNIILVFTHGESVESDDAFRGLMQRQRDGFPALDNLLRSCGERIVMLNSGRRFNQDKLNLQTQNLLFLIGQVAKSGRIGIYADVDTDTKTATVNWLEMMSRFFCDSGRWCWVRLGGMIGFIRRCFAGYKIF